MNFEKILAENLIRFGVKNVDTNKFNFKYLTEQTTAELIAKWESDTAAKAEFDKWESGLGNTVKLVKGFGYRDVTEKPEVAVVQFFNNFVTIEQGTTDPEAAKKEIDRVLDKLEQAGAELENPKTVITIVSTATTPPAGTNMDSGAIAAGRTKLDHNYDLSTATTNFALKMQLDAKQKKDKQWGNKILARKRGESAKKYLEERGIKAKINVKVLINQEKRRFQISAMVAGQEKFIAPIDLIDPEFTISWSISATRIGNFNDISYGTPDGVSATKPNDIPAVAVTWNVSTNFGWKSGNGGSRVWPFDTSFGSMKAVYEMAKNPEAYDGSKFSYDRGYRKGNIFAQEKLEGHRSAAAQGRDSMNAYRNIDPTRLLKSCGHFETGKANEILRFMKPGSMNLQYLSSPLMQAITGLDVNAWLTQYQQACKSFFADQVLSYVDYSKPQQYTADNAPHPSFIGRSIRGSVSRYSEKKPDKWQMGYSRYGQGDSLVQVAYSKTKKDFDSTMSSLTNKGTIKLSVSKLAELVGAGASVERQKDSKYWGDAAYYDYTVNPAKTGTFDKNPYPAFWEGVEFAAKSE